MDDKKELLAMEREFASKTLVEHIDIFGKNLTEWEVNFIADLMDNPPKTYSIRQKEIINRIYDQKC